MENISPMAVNPNVRYGLAGAFFVQKRYHGRMSSVQAVLYATSEFDSEFLACVGGAFHPNAKEASIADLLKGYSEMQCNVRYAS